MEKIRMALPAWKIPANGFEDESEMCCGKCRFSHTAPDLEMKCMRHKIRTDSERRCGDWKGKETTDRKGA